MFLLANSRGAVIGRHLPVGGRIMSAMSSTAKFACQPAMVPVYFDHDGGNDDFVALVYFLKHQHRCAFYLSI